MEEGSGERGVGSGEWGVTGKGAIRNYPSGFQI